MSRARYRLADHGEKPRGRAGFAHQEVEADLYSWQSRQWVRTTGGGFCRRRLNVQPTNHGEVELWDACRGTIRRLHTRWQKDVRQDRQRAQNSQINRPQALTTSTLILDLHKYFMQNYLFLYQIKDISNLKFIQKSEKNCILNIRLHVAEE